MEARMLGPEMIRRGYSKGFTCSAIAVGSLITATIPPSLGLILYGYVGNVSIGRLFLAGIVPGLLMMGGLMAVVWIIAHRRGYQPASKELPNASAVWRAVADAKWALLFPVALLVGIRGGVLLPPRSAPSRSSTPSSSASSSTGSSPSRASWRRSARACWTWA
jgi:TRAP-type C4-dicarboxylate transport system permease large subunit